MRKRHNQCLTWDIKCYGADGDGSARSGLFSAPFGRRHCVDPKNRTQSLKRSLLRRRLDICHGRVCSAARASVFYARLRTLSTVLLIGIAVGISLDAFAVSVASGVVIKERMLRHALRIALFFGVAQAVMPLVGWLGGNALRQSGWISSIDHWLAFGLLTAIGCKMIYEAFRLESGGRKSGAPGTWSLLVLSIATSLDALAVGMTLSFLHGPIVEPIIVIGVVTFTLSLAGVVLGDWIGHLFESKLQVVGGLVLIGIGVKVLLEHLG